MSEFSAFTAIQLITLFGVTGGYHLFALLQGLSVAGTATARRWTAHYADDRFAALLRLAQAAPHVAASSCNTVTQISDELLQERVGRNPALSRRHQYAMICSAFCLARYLRGLPILFRKPSSFRPCHLRLIFRRTFRTSARRIVSFSSSGRPLDSRYLREIPRAASASALAGQSDSVKKKKKSCGA